MTRCQTYLSGRLCFEFSLIAAARESANLSGHISRVAHEIAISKMGGYSGSTILFTTTFSHLLFAKRQTAIFFISARLYQIPYACHAFRDTFVFEFRLCELGHDKKRSVEKINTTKKSLRNTKG